MRKLLSPLPVILIAMLAGGCARSEDPETPPLDKVRVATLPFLSYAPFAVALEENYFQEEGIDVELVNLDQSSSIPATIRGDLDVWSGLVNAGLLNAIRQGNALRVVADKGQISTDCVSEALLLRASLAEERPSPDAQSLAGLKVYYRSASTQEYLLEEFYRRQGADWSSIQQVSIPFPAILDAFETGGLDLHGATEPNITQATDRGVAVVWVPLGDFFPREQTAIVAYGQRLLREDRDLGERFMRAYIRGIRQIEKGKTRRNIEILARFTHLPEETLARACWTAFDPRGEVNLSSIESFSAWAVRKGYLDRAVPMEQVYDGSFVQAVGEDSASLLTGSGNLR